MIYAMDWLHNSTLFYLNKVKIKYYIVAHMNDYTAQTMVIFETFLTGLIKTNWILSKAARLYMNALIFVITVVFAKLIILNVCLAQNKQMLIYLKKY